mmetsp:Transcript_58761/g.131422  ORF Transcript_58761/g.131422 Transcript_58761/m.131422 type:complete len:352 (-) Transcript_58761:187-1242(-)
MAPPWRGVLCGAVVFLLSSLPGVVVDPPIVDDRIPPNIPAVSALANSIHWDALKHEVTADDVKFFEEHGYVIMRDVLRVEAIDIMRKEAEKVCDPQLQDSYVCRVKQARFRSDIFRDFLLHSPVGTMARSILQRGADKPLRVLEDGVFGHTWREYLLTYFSFYHHVDGNGAGVYHTFPRGTPGVSLWVPLQDLDPSTNGGSVNVFGGGIYPKHCFWGSSGCFVLGRPENMTTPKVNRGDIVLWHPMLLHSAQPVLASGFTRYVYFSWLVDADAKSCRTIGCSSQMGFPCCRDDPVAAGRGIQHACYPQVGPALEDEIRTYIEGSLIDPTGARDDGPGDVAACLSSEVTALA